MGFFSNRKKKKAEKAALEAQKLATANAEAEQKLADQELAVISAAMMAASEEATPADAELLAVISAAIAAAESASQPYYGPDSPEVVAVIAAAIAAYEQGSAGGYYNSYGYDNVQTRRSYRKINRTAGCAPAWGVAGNREAIDSRRF